MATIGADYPQIRAESDWMGWQLPAESARFCRVLYITNNTDDYTIISSLISSPDFELHHAPDGESGISRLREVNVNLVMAAWQLPDMSGLDLLRHLKDDPRLRILPVILLADPATDAALNDAYGMGASCVIRLPSNLSEMTRLVKAIADFWASFAQLPFCLRR